MLAKEENQSTPQIYITKFDLECLRALITRLFRAGAEAKRLARLNAVLDSAEVLSTANLSEESVTLDSKLRVKELDCNRDLILTIVLPLQSDKPAQNFGSCSLGHFNVRTQSGRHYRGRSPGWNTDVSYRGNSASARNDGIP
jgi:transcription elongation GreA/GreB family factor